nr:helix-turn-helix transcriptional regulator [Streptomyces albireticuli]
MVPVNERLRIVLGQRGVTPERLAEVCGVDPKTVGRWLGGRTPRQRHRWKVAQHLKVEENYLWPPETARGQEGTRSEIIDVYPDRASVHRDVWISLLLGAVEQIDVLVLRNLFRADQSPRRNDARRTGRGWSACTSVLR